MERYLLFDSACMQCSQLAHTIEQTSGGWCTVRSLREPSMQELLREANPQWKWEPTLIEVQEKNVQSFTGFALRTHLLKEVGPRKAWKLLQAIGRAYVSSESIDSSRRRFLKRGTAVLAALALTVGISDLKPAHAQVNTGDSLTTSFSTTPLEANDPLVQQLRQMDVVKAANQSIGTPDWTTVFKVRRGGSSNTVYVVNYQPRTSQVVVKATFLGIASTSKAVVAQLLHTDEQTNEQKMQFAWLTPEMHYLGTTTTFVDGKVEASTENPHHLGVAGLATPNFSWGCFITCLVNAHVPGWCIQLCQLCWFPPICAACAGCATGAYVYCVATC